jgi:DNA-binding response OmpR family regulator
MNVTLDVSAPLSKSKALRPKKNQILLVDDDPAIRQFVLRLLEEEGYLVLTAANGVEAIKLVNDFKIDLLLLDLSMPVKDGWDTFEQVIKISPLLPVILITARSNQLFPALASGVGALLEKPLDFAKLLSTIRCLLEESPEVRQARIAGRPSAFRYVPPIPGTPEWKAH